MAYLADTNILLRFIAPEDTNHLLIRNIVHSLLNRGEEICYTSQNLAEFWNVCTRPATARSGFGLSIEETDIRAQIIERYLTFLPDDAAVHTEWRRIVVDYRVFGVKVHDARLVAAMCVHGVSDIITFNADDFTRYTGIAVHHPTTIRV